MKMRGFSKIILLPIILTLVVFVGFGISRNARAQTTSSQIVDVNFPCPDGSFGLGSCPPSTDIPSYINNLYKFAVGIAGLLALGMIVAGGVYYTVSAGSSDKQREAKDMITSAVWGVVLLFASYMILNTVNPQITLLNINFSGASKLSPTPPAESTNVVANCPAFSVITIHPPVTVKAISSYGSTCEYRKNVLTSQATFVTDDKYYDKSFFNKSIDAGATIWTYPYFISSNGASTAQCLIYAYQNPGTTVVNMVALQNTISLCAPQDQKLPACKAWTFTAQESGTKGGAQTPVNITVSVSGSFNYPDTLNPPPTSASGGTPGLNKSHCYTTYCTNAAWSCSSS